MPQDDANMDSCSRHTALGVSCVERELPLSREQLPLWFNFRLDPQDFANNVGLAVRIFGSLDIEALKHAVDRLTARHENLRTTFDERGGRPVAKVNYSLSPNFHVHHCTEWSQARTSREIESWHRRPFNLFTGPNFRIGLFQLAPREHVVVVSLPHIIADLRSLEIILDDLETYYCDEAAVGQTRWLETPRSYLDQVQSEQRFLAGAAGKAAETYWVATMAAPPATLELPFPVEGQSEVFSHYGVVPRDLYTSILELVQEGGLSLHSVLLAAWACLIGGFAEQNEFVIGVPTSIREESFARTVGTFVNPLPIRVTLEGCFRDIATRGHRSTLEALEHRQYPFYSVVTQVCRSREAGRNPLYQTAINSLGGQRTSRWTSLYLDAGEYRIAWADLQLAGWRLSQQEAQVDLALDFVEADGGLRYVIKGRTDVVPKRLIGKIEAKFARILQEAVANPDGRSFVESVRARAVDFKSLQEAMSPGPVLDAPLTNVVQRIDAVARANGEKEAITCTGRRVSYGELHARSIAVANFLHSAGVRAGARVGVCLRPSADAVIAMLGIMRIGASYVPLDLQAPLDRLTRVVSQSGIKVVFGSSEIAWPSSDSFVRVDDVGAVRPQGDAPTPTGLLDRVAYTLFTSGSTGEPKGIDVQHKSLVALLDATAREIEHGPDDVWAWFHVASFDLSVWEIWGCLSSGARLVIVPRELRSRPDALIDLLTSEKVTILQQTPSGLQALAVELRRRNEKLNVRHVVSCGEPLPGKLARFYLEQPVKLWNMYGPAETTVYASFSLVDRTSAGFGIVPIGRPLALAAMYVLNANLQPVDEGEVGELFIGGLGVAVGYVGLLEETSRRFLPNPYGEAGSRMYRTGDYVLWDGEQLHFKGRRDNQVKILGHRIELEDVEVALREAGGVANAAVVVERSHTESRLIGVLALHADGSIPMEESIRSDLAERIPAYMVPARFLVAPSLPQNAHHKLDRRALQRMISEGSCKPLRNREEAGLSVASRTADAIRAIWRRTLHRDDVKLDDQFFAIGGNSLLLMETFDLVRELPGASALTPTDLFRFPTVQSLAAHLDGTPKAAPTNKGQSRAQTRLRLRRTN